MSNLGRARRQDAEWQVVSERNRCLICGATQGCHRDLEGEFACCSRRPSDWPLTSGEWLHRVESIDLADGSVATTEVVVAVARAFAPPSPLPSSAQ